MNRVVVEKDSATTTGRCPIVLSQRSRGSQAWQALDDFPKLLAYGRTCRPSEVCSLIGLGRQRLRLEIPRDGEHGRAFGTQRQEPLAVFDDHTFRRGKVECAVGPGPIADQEGEAGVAGTLFPVAMRPMEAGRPRPTSQPGGIDAA